MPTDEDPFERAARREAEIAEELARGRLSSEQAEQLRDLLGPGDGDDAGGSDGAGDGDGGAEGDTSQLRNRLTLTQLRRILDEGVEPEVLAGALANLPGLSVDEVIDLLVDFGPDEDFFVELGRADLADLDLHSVTILLENGIEPDDLQRLRRSGLRVSARQVARLCEEGADLGDLADLAERAESVGGSGLRLTIEQLARMGSEGIDLDSVLALSELDVALDQAIDLAAGEVDPSVLRRLLAEGLDVNWDQLIDPVRHSSWPGPMIGFKGRRRHVGLVLGDHIVGSDATVSGAVLGSVTIRPGARVTIDAVVVGDVVVQAHATVLIRGAVRGRVRNHGGHVEVTGSVRGGIEEVVDEAV